MTQFNAEQQQQPLSVISSTVMMGTRSLELRDIDRNKNTSNIMPSVINIGSYDNDWIENNRFHIIKKSPSSKMKSFFKQYLKALKLVFKSIIPDLKSFKYWQIIILIIFATFNVVFSILDFNSFLPQKPQEPKLSLLKWINEQNNGVALWRRILLCLSGVAAFTNVLNVVLVIRGKFSSYFWGIIGAILYGAYSFAYNYVGDAQLYIFFFLPMQFIGMYTWSKELDNQSTTRVKSLKLIGWIIIIIVCVGLGALFFYEIPAFSKAITGQYFFEDMLAPHILDASTNAISIVGQFLLILCYWEQYILWLIVNIMAIIMYSGLLTRLDINLLVVFIMFAINSLVGLYTWFRRWKNLNK